MGERISFPSMSGQSQLPNVFFCILGLNLDLSVAQWRTISGVYCPLKGKFLRYICNSLPWPEKKDLEHTVWQRFGGDKFKFFVGVVSK